MQLIDRKLSTGKSLKIYLNKDDTVSVYVDDALLLSCDFKNIESATVKGCPQFTHVLDKKVALLKGEMNIIVETARKIKYEREEAELMKNPSYKKLHDELDAETKKIKAYNNLQNEGYEGYNPHEERCSVLLDQILSFKKSA